MTKRPKPRQKVIKKVASYLRSVKGKKRRVRIQAYHYTLNKADGNKPTAKRKTAISKSRSKSLRPTEKTGGKPSKRIARKAFKSVKKIRKQIARVRKPAKKKDLDGGKKAKNVRRVTVKRSGQKRPLKKDSQNVRRKKVVKRKVSDSVFTITKTVQKDSQGNERISKATGEPSESIDIHLPSGTITEKINQIKNAPLDFLDAPLNKYFDPNAIPTLMKINGKMVTLPVGAKPPQAMIVKLVSETDGKKRYFGLKTTPFDFEVSKDSIRTYLVDQMEKFTDDFHALIEDRGEDDDVDDDNESVTANRYDTPDADPDSLSEISIVFIYG